VAAASALLAEDSGLPVVLLVHDETVCEIPGGSAGEAATRVLGAMMSAPEWSAGLPIACDASAAQRYSKG
jgi:DNA polymerase I-like protein with 3'-5' exonuclease and polymerase domains